MSDAARMVVPSTEAMITSTGSPTSRFKLVTASVTAVLMPPMMGVRLSCVAFSALA